jgi:membrane fusion protein, macrolide-specific efflux system
MPNPVQFARSRPLVTALIVVVVAALAFGVWRVAFYQPAPQYLTADATRMDIEESVLATGVIRPCQQVAVGARVSGQVKSLEVKLGDHVKRGQLLAEIDPTLQQNDLRRAEASLADTRAQRDAKVALLHQYQNEQARQEYMLKRDASSQASYEVAKANVETTAANIRSLNAQIVVAEIAVDTARVNLAYTRITAPIDGEIISVVTQAGQTVVSAQAAPVIFIMANLDQMTVRAKISEADVVRVKPGLLVHFTILGAPDTRYDSALRAIEPAPESIAAETTQQQFQQPATTNSAVYYNGLFDVPNPSHMLRASMTAQVSIVLGGARNVLTVPMSALGRHLAANRYEVRVLQTDGRPKVQLVTIGLANDTNAQLLSGLAEGERVIIGDSAAAQAGGDGH